MVTLVIVVATFGLILVLQRVRKRRAGFAAFAIRRGLRYETSAVSVPLEELTGLTLFHTGWESSLCHLVFGRSTDRELYMFEFSTKAGPQMNDPETSQTVIALRLEGVPAFRLYPPSDLRSTRTGDAPEGTPFAEADRSRALPRAFLDRVRRTSKWRVEGNGRWVVFWQPSRIVAPEMAGEFLDEVLALAQDLSGSKGVSRA